jgi:hypothetical protein
MSDQLHAPAALLPGINILGTRGTDWIGGWVGLRDGPDAVEKNKNLASAGNRTPAIQPVDHCSADRAIPTLGK